jgi:hypothetical protein
VRTSYLALSTRITEVRKPEKGRVWPRLNAGQGQGEVRLKALRTFLHPWL